MNRVATVMAERMLEHMRAQVAETFSVRALVNEPLRAQFQRQMAEMFRPPPPRPPDLRARVADAIRTAERGQSWK